jgi:hypothetical protein
LGLAIPLATILTVALPVPGGEAVGVLTGVAGGVLAYVGAAHLLPEAQAEHASKGIGVFFALTLVVSAAGLMAVPGW